MKKKTIFLHIGLGKTGTTSIQQFFVQNTPALEQLGILYPKTGRGKSIAHHEAVWQIGYDATLLDIPRNPYLWKRLLSEIHESPADNIVISSECFYAHYFLTNEIKQLQELLSGFLVKIIVYLRRQDTHLLSWYKEEFKSRDERKWPTSLEEFIEVREKIRYYEYDYYLDKWANAFGEGNIIVKLYEATAGDAHIEAFFKIILPKINIGSLIKPSRLNESLSNRTVMVFHLLRDSLGSIPWGLGIKLVGVARFIILSRYFQWLLRSLPSKIFSCYIMDEKQRSSFLKYYESTNWKILSNYLTEEEGQKAFFQSGYLPFNEEWSNKLA